MSSAWSAHLPPGTSDLYLLADRSLPGSWTRRWAENGAARVLHEDAT